MAITYSCRADGHNPLQYHGGPILRSFKIYPLYYGKWSDDEISEQQNYLKGLTAYMSGDNNPAGQQPVTWQYGVYEASSGPKAISNTNAEPKELSTKELRNIIHENQKSGNLPKFGPDVLIMVFPAHGFTVTDNPGGGFHNSESEEAFWGVVPRDAGVGAPVKGKIPVSPGPYQLVTGHEVIEAMLDPGVNNTVGWDEAVDGCPDGISTFGGSWVNLTFGWLPGPTDNTQNGSCSVTGFTSTEEIQGYGYLFTDYKKKYDELWPQGWRLYILQSFENSDGKVYYNAVWRQWTGDEEQIYGSTYNDFKSKYDGLYPQGWRLYILQSYVTSNNETLYNAVWRRGNLGETQIYGSAFTDYKAQYDEQWKQNMRLQSLQPYISNGEVKYNAVWRPGVSEEIKEYKKSLGEIKKEYDKIWTEGWRLYILQSYSKANGKVFSDAVWRRGKMPEKQVYGVSYDDYKKKYDELWPEGWRLYILDTYTTKNGEIMMNAVWRLGVTDKPL